MACAARVARHASFARFSLQEYNVFKSFGSTKGTGVTALVSNVTNLIIFGLMLGLLVFVHEFGHFIVAKRLHIPVLEFGFGFPPRLIRLMKRDETEYTLNAVPLGGFVRLMGEEDPNVPGGFASAKPSVRAPILLAGVTMNFLLALVVFTIGAFASPPYAPVQTTRIAAVVPDSPAALAGLAKGDTIVAVNGRNIKDDYQTLSQMLRENAGQSVTLTIMRSGRMGDPISIVPRANPPPGQGPLGIALEALLGLRVSSVEPGSVSDRAGVRRGDVLAFVVDPQKGRTLRDQNELAQFAMAHPGFKIDWHVARNGKLLDPDPITVQIPDSVDAKNAALGLNLQTSLLDAPRAAAQDMWLVIESIPLMISQVARGSIPGDSFVGPIGIYQLTGEVAERGGVLGLVRWLGLLSLNLAIFNLLPIPALDGGRLVFVLLEWVRGGKRIDPQKEGLVHLIGIAVLLGFVIVISFFDVQRLLDGRSIFPLP